MAGLEKVPAVVRNVADDSALAIGLVENLQREDLNPIDQAQAIKRLVEMFSMTHQEIAETLGRSRAGVTTLLRLLDLPPAVMAMLADGQLDMGHARALLTLPADQQRSAAQCVVAGDLSVREVERMVKQATHPEVAAPAIDQPAIPEPPVVAESDGLWAGLKKRLGRGVGLKRQNNGRWRMNITFSDLDELRLALRAIDDTAQYLQQASPENASPEKAQLEQVRHEETRLEQASPNQALLEQAPHGQASPTHTVPERAPHGLVSIKANQG